MLFDAKMALGMLREATRAGGLRVRISGDCMQPALSQGEIVEVRPSRLLFPGDIVVFLGADSRLTAHRVLGYRPGRPWTLLTRSDTAEFPDGAIPLSQVLGRVVPPRWNSVTPSHRLNALFSLTARAAAAVSRRLVRSR
jgi:Peptidase S24-like